MLIEQDLEYCRTLSNNIGNECIFNGLVIHQSVPGYILYNRIKPVRRRGGGGRRGFRPPSF
jgi:hypothetical protein